MNNNVDDWIYNYAYKIWLNHMYVYMNTKMSYIHYKLCWVHVKSVSHNMHIIIT